MAYWLIPSHRAALSRFGGLMCAAGACALLLFGCSRDLTGVASITAVPNGTSLVVSWAAVSGVAQYDIFLSQSPSVSPSSYTSEFTSNTSNLTITGLTAGSTYYLVVVPTALGGLAMGPASNVVAVDVTGTSSTPTPVITALSVSPDPSSVGQTVLFAATASDSNGDTLSYTWTLNGTALSNPSPSIGQYDWTASCSTAPTTPCSDTLQVSVTDTITGATATTATTFSVQ